MMRVGDLVWVVQQLGCGVAPRHFRDHGCGVVLEISGSGDLDFGSKIGKVNVGRDVIVALSSGEVRKFNEQSMTVLTSP